MHRIHFLGWWLLLVFPLSAQNTSLTIEQRAAICYWLELYQKEDPLLKKSATLALIACGPELFAEYETVLLQNPIFTPLLEILKAPQHFLLEELESKADAQLKQFLSRYQQQQNFILITIPHRKLNNLPPPSAPLFLDTSFIQTYKELEPIVVKQLSELFQKQEIYPLVPKNKAEYFLVPKILRPRIYTVSVDGEEYWQGELQFHLCFYKAESTLLLQEISTEVSFRQKKILMALSEFLPQFVQKTIGQIESHFKPQSWSVEVPLFKGKNFKYERGIYLLLSKQPDLALHFFRQMGTEERDADFFFNLGVTYELQQRILEAIKSYQQALALDPESKNYQKAVHRCQSLLAPK